VAEALVHFGAERVRGELVLILPPVPKAAPATGVEETLRRLMLDEGMSRSAAVRQAAKTLGVSRSEVYRVSLGLGGNEEGDGGR
jgi:16S rRNA C1402 (ribose-2'-O) methylase RsmI